MNADHFLLSGIRTSQHNTSKTKSTKPLSNISFLLFFISTNCSSSSLATQKGLFLVLNISYTILSLPTKVEHCYHQSPATILKRKKVKRGLPIASRLKVRRALCSLQAPSKNELELPLLSYFLLHLLIAQMLTQRPSRSPNSCLHLLCSLYRNAICFIPRCQNPIQSDFYHCGSTSLPHPGSLKGHSYLPCGF